MMGNCSSSINCTAVDQPVEANPDIAGIGVMLSFVATAIITFIAIVIGYLSDSLPDTSLSQLDRACIAKFSTIRWRPWIKDGPMSLLLRRSMTVAMGVFGWNYAVADHNEGLDDDDTSRDARERRSKGLEKFILALSDQQLVTGLAILIAGFVSPCSMSIYHFSIIAALGWFSSTTHLATLAVLRAYFIEHPRLRNWRVVAMLLVLALLIVTQGVTAGTSTLDYSLPVLCAFNQSSSSAATTLRPISIAMIIIFLGATYSDRIVRLYVLDPQWSLQAWLADAVLMAWKNRLGTRRQFIGQELVKIIIQSSSKTKAEQVALWRSLNERRRYSRHYYKLRSKRPGGVRRILLILITLTEINHSFLGDLSTLQFGVTLGLTQVIVSRINVPEAGIVGSQNNINFGQLVPLLLMLLPLFAAGEVYFERREDILTRPSGDNTIPAKRSHGKPFFSRKIGLADSFEVYHSTQPILDGTSHELNASNSPQSLGSVSPGVGGATSVELQNLPTARLRRPDTETGLGAPTTQHGGLPSTASGILVAETGIQSAKDTKKPPSVGRFIAVLVTCIVIGQTLLAIDLVGGVKVLALVGVIIIALYSIATAVNTIYSIAQALEESRN